MSASLRPVPRWLDVSFWVAGSNWEMWLRDYSYTGPPVGLPVLSNPSRFLAFVSEYKLFRGLPSTARLSARSAIIGSPTLAPAFTNTTGADIDRLAISLRASGATKNLEIVLLSKLAAFYAPNSFNPCDKFARAGIKAWISGGSSGGSYQNYCTQINGVLSGPLGMAINTYISSHHPPTGSSPLAFQRRMLDVYLMLEGGRWNNVI